MIILYNYSPLTILHCSHFKKSKATKNALSSNNGCRFLSNVTQFLYKWSKLEVFTNSFLLHILFDKSKHVSSKLFYSRLTYFYMNTMNIDQSRQSAKCFTPSFVAAIFYKWLLSKIIFISGRGFCGEEFKIFSFRLP